MSFADSLWISLLGLAVVFAVLIFLSFFLTILSSVLGFVVKNNNEKNVAGAGDSDVPYIVEELDGECSGGELKLIGVDEPTAAMIMAIISDESQIPLSQLRFKTIKAID
ncbi:MAG: OadG family protein [Syntrophomonadaceae bacterium]|jgi:Na+-transporting methylmalonyl-CoA/oxaloacetate decarboxylase gamma subunit|nr:OadG family protein [Bacillota bacterium]NLP25709.1 OadG family protein [Syntrophomonadaceae bacterium]